MERKVNDCLSEYYSMLLMSIYIFFSDLHISIIQLWADVHGREIAMHIPWSLQEKVLERGNFSVSTT